MSALLDHRLQAVWAEPMPAEAIVLLVGMLGCMIGARIVAEALNLQWIAGLLLMSPAFVAVYIAAGWIALRRNAREVRAILLVHGHCASCGYCLAGIPAGGNGLTTCPERAAAWQLPKSAAPTRC